MPLLNKSGLPRVGALDSTERGIWRMGELGKPVTRVRKSRTRLPSIPDGLPLARSRYSRHNIGDCLEVDDRCSKFVCSRRKPSAESLQFVKRRLRVIHFFSP